jgi:hypothetical protein
VFVPFGDAIKSSVPKTKGFDMTTGNRLMSFLSLLPIMNVDRRPRLVTFAPDENEKVPKEITPVALFEDLQESIFLMENSSGLRPYQIEWYEKVFLPAFNDKTTADSRMVKNQLVSENIIAVTTEQLAKKTKEVYNRHTGSKKILETYLEPLLNEGYIDRTGSDIDHRTHIYYPLIDISKVFDYSINGSSNNILHRSKIIVRNIAAYPYKLDIISKIREVFRYSIEKEFRTMIKNDNWDDMTPEELVNRYYNNAEEYFDYVPIDIDYGNSSPVSRHYPYLIAKKHMFGNPTENEYFQKDEIANESQENTEDNIKSTSPEDETQNILFDEPKIEQSNTIQSPYESIIQIEHLESGQEYYRCKIHPDIWRTDLTQMEGHCRHEHGGLS